MDDFSFLLAIYERDELADALELDFLTWWFQDDTPESDGWTCQLWFEFHDPCIVEVLDDHLLIEVVHTLDIVACAWLSLKVQDLFSLATKHFDGPLLWEQLLHHCDVYLGVEGLRKLIQSQVPQQIDDLTGRIHQFYLNDVLLLHEVEWFKTDLLLEEVII